MRERQGVWRILMAVGLCAALSSDSATQDGWRQLDVHRPDGPHTEANHADVPDPADASASVGESLPAPTHPVSQDVVPHDGERTGGRVTPIHAPHSDGVVRKRGSDIDLKAMAQMFGGFFDIN
jgi:hypothetical protein